MQNESQKKATDHAMMQYVARACPSLAVRVQQYWGCEYRVSWARWRAFDTQTTGYRKTAYSHGHAGHQLSSSDNHC